jgi:outer membrane autotransporter protein
VGSDGFASPSALVTLQPEAYASASQIGIDNGLVLSSTVRSSGDLGNNGRQGFFGLGQGFGAWHRLNGNPTTGVSRANVNTGGFLGGIGFASDNIVATAFVGRIYADQSFGRLAAETKTEGTFIGGSLAFSSAGLQAGGSFIWDDSSADTRRTLYDGSRATGHYNLRSLTLDGHIAYRFNLRKGGWQVGPRMGLTHVAVKRGGLSESGAGAFSLDVARRTTKATFFDADLELTMAGDTALRPWLSAGWQHRIDGDPILAIASFTGTSSQFTTSGTERARDFAHVGAGVDWYLRPSLDLFAKIGSTFGSGSGANNATIGLRLDF